MQTGPWRVSMVGSLFSGGLQHFGNNLVPHPGSISGSALGEKISPYTVRRSDTDKPALKRAIFGWLRESIAGGSEEESEQEELHFVSLGLC